MVIQWDLHCKYVYCPLCWPVSSREMNDLDFFHSFFIPPQFGDPEIARVM